MEYKYLCSLKCFHLAPFITAFSKDEHYAVLYYVQVHGRQLLLLFYLTVSAGHHLSGAHCTAAPITWNPCHKAYSLFAQFTFIIPSSLLFLSRLGQVNIDHSNSFWTLSCSKRTDVMGIVEISGASLIEGYVIRAQQHVLSL